ncbi:hypothetical protein B0H16DRAFT_1539083 [Mycena metata]|uniref:Uncharacterized protein n=1 Tax=Mycena metata TaxID=1033252 RepID=A0AAD7NEB5_9AGAR|nr:hypothetical protein B0H16DRAFT_1539083 [Mycena metata]
MCSRLLLRPFSLSSWRLSTFLNMYCAAAACEAPSIFLALSNPSTVVRDHQKVAYSADDRGSPLKVQPRHKQPNIDEPILYPYDYTTIILRLTHEFHLF